MTARCRVAKLFGAAANAISSPPGEYVRKNETQRTEAADAEDFADQVTAVYNCAQGKGEIGLLLCFIEPADGANRAGFFFGKAAVTDTFGIHSSSHSAAKAAFDDRQL